MKKKNYIRDICYNQFSGELIIPENGNLEKL